MKSSKASKSLSRVRNRARSVKITSTAHGLTSQAGLIPVVKYLDKIGFGKTVEKNRATAYKFQSKNITFSLNESFNAALNRFFFKLIFEGSVFSKLIAS